MGMPLWLTKAPSEKPEKKAPVPMRPEHSNIPTLTCPCCDGLAQVDVDQEWNVCEECGCRWKPCYRVPVLCTRCGPPPQHEMCCAKCATIIDRTPRKDASK